MKTLEEVLTVLREAAPSFKNKYLITKIGVFGSYARGNRQQRVILILFISATQQLALLFLNWFILMMIFKLFSI